MRASPSRHFRPLVTSYPQSEYAHDARQRMIFLRNRLADYEVYVADHYLRRGAYVAAVGAREVLVENYDGAPAVEEALEIMTECVSQDSGSMTSRERSRECRTARISPKPRSASDKKKKWWAVW